jgi:hypothetical protein
MQLIPFGPRKNLLFKGCGSFQLWYQLSKTLAEEAAWKFAEECGIDLVAINPGFSVGPLIQPTPTSSMMGFLKLMKGTLLVGVCWPLNCLNNENCQSNLCFPNCLSLMSRLQLFNYCSGIDSNIPSI